METIPISECVKIGYLQKPHGIRGEVILHFEEEFEDSIANSSIFFVSIDGLLVPYFITDEEIRFRTGNSAILKFNWIDSNESAREICGKGVYLKQEQIILSDEEVGKHELVGYLIFDSILGEIGLVQEVDDFSGNVVLTTNYKGNELMIPLNDELTDSIDHKEKKMFLHIPEGLISL